jgi:hypothetical protein
MNAEKKLHKLRTKTSALKITEARREGVLTMTHPI